MLATHPLGSRVRPLSWLNDKKFLKVPVSGTEFANDLLGGRTEEKKENLSNRTQPDQSGKTRLTNGP